MHRKVLGRGLDALIPGSASATATAETRSNGSVELDVEDIAPNPHQPRTIFDDDAIRELAADRKSVV